MSIRYKLDSLNVEDVRSLCRAAKIDYAGRKGEMMDRLETFYENLDVYRDVYLKLSDYEKAILDKFIEYNFHPYEKDLVAIREKYKYHSSYGAELYKKSSPLRLLGYGNFGISYNFYKELLKIRKPKEIKFTKINEQNRDDNDYEVDSSKHIELLEEMLKYFSSNKTVVSPKSKLISKSDFLKFYRSYPYEEILKDCTLNITNIKTIEDTTVFYGIYKLLVISDVFDVSQKELTMGSNFLEFVRMDRVNKLKFLLDGYQNDTSTFINEVARIQSKKYITGDSNPSFDAARSGLIDLISKMPVESWVSVAELYEFWHIYNYNAVHNTLGGIYYKESGYYYEDSNTTFLFIDVMLVEYLCSMGLIDIVYEYDQCWYTMDVSPYYIRLTKMGAMALGLIEYEEEISDDLPLTVTDDFKIIVNDTPKRFREEVYLNGVFEVVDGYYNINFASMARYMDEGNNMHDVVNHLKENADVPSNVMDTLETWLENTSNIKVKTVKVIEADEVLKRVILNDKILSSSIDVQDSIMFVKKGKEAKLKKDLEKKDIYINIK